MNPKSRSRTDQSEQAGRRQSTGIHRRDGKDIVRRSRCSARMARDGGPERRRVVCGSLQRFAVRMRRRKLGAGGRDARIDDDQETGVRLMEGELRSR